MSTPLTDLSVSFPAWRVAEAVGLEEWAVRQMHPGVFPSPQCWVEEGAKLTYTTEGVRQLAENFRKRGYPTKAHALGVLIEQRLTVPSREFVRPTPKGGDWWWQKGLMA